MLELIQYIVGQFAEDKENVEYVVNEKDRVIEVTVIWVKSLASKVKLLKQCVQSYVLQRR